MANTGFNVNTDLVKGDDLYLYLYSGETTGNADVLAFATSVSLQVDQETIDTSNKMACRWNSNLAGKAGYTISADALYTQKEGALSFDALMAKMIDGQAVKWVIGNCTKSLCPDPDYSLKTPLYKGEALISSLSLEAGNNEVASCSISMTGSGAIEAV